jgi:hypothetical protein
MDHSEGEHSPERPANIGGELEEDVDVLVLALVEILVDVDVVLVVVLDVVDELIRNLRMRTPSATYSSVSLTSTPRRLLVAPRYSARTLDPGELTL